MSTLELRKKPALLVIDAQNTFCHPDSIFSKSVVQVPPENIHKMIDGINRLRKSFHERGLPVIFVGYAFDEDYSEAGNWEGVGPELREKGSGLRGSWDAAIVDELKMDTSKNETFVEKYRYNSFHGTKLAEVMNDQGIDQLFVTGCATNFCVESTVRSAYDQGLRAVTISDATAAVTEQEQQSALSNLQWFGGVASCEEVEEALERL